MPSNDWKLIMQAAHEMGVNKWTRWRWRQRGKVPHRWRIPLIQHTGGLISIQMFERLDRALAKKQER